LAQIYRLKKQSPLSLVFICMSIHLQDLYVQLCLEDNKAPVSVYAFAKAAGITESEFYNHFASLDALESDLFRSWWAEAVRMASAVEVYSSYSGREKMLSLFFTWIEVLRKNRSFVQFVKSKHHSFPPQIPAWLKPLREQFMEDVKPILHESIGTKEIVDRKYLSDKYVEGLWVNFLFITDFWLKDQSKGFEKTDEAIEKSLHLSFDLLGKSALDTALEFGKFLFQQKK